MEKNKKIRALKIKALCSIIVKLVTMEMESIFKEKQIDIGVSQMILLKILRSNPFTVQELSIQIFVSPATLIPMVDSLEKKGLVKRSTDKKDRRKNPIILTKKGVQFIETVSKLVDEHPFIHTVEKFSQKKADRTISLLQELVLLMTGNDNAIKIITNTAEMETSTKGDYAR